jgi:hypothetical protein
LALTFKAPLISEVEKAQKRLAKLGASSSLKQLQNEFDLIKEVH